MERKAAQEFLRFLCATTCALHAPDADRAFAARNSKVTIQYFPRNSVSFGRHSIEDFQPFAARFAPGTGLGRKSPDQTIDFARGPAPVDPCFLFRDFPCIGRAVRRLRPLADRVAFE